MVFITDKIGLRHFSSTTWAFPVRVQSYPDIAPLFVHRSLWRYIEALFNREYLYTDFHGR